MYNMSHPSFGSGLVGYRQVNQMLTHNVLINMMAIMVDYVYRIRDNAIGHIRITDQLFN